MITAGIKLNTMTFSQPVFVCTFIALTIAPVKHTIAIFFIVLPAAFIAFAAGVIISPLAIHIVVFPFALITVTVTPVKGSTAFFFSIDPITLVTIAIGIQINAMTFSQPVFVCTFIALTIIPAKNSMTVFFTVFHCACVFSIRISLFYNGIRTLFLPFFKIFSRYRTYGTIFNKIFPFVKSTLGTFIFTLFLSRTHRTNPHFFPSFDFQNRLFHEIIFPFTHLESTIRRI